MYSRHRCPMQNQAGNGDNKTDDVDNMQDEYNEVDVQKLPAMSKNPETFNCSSS